MEKAQLIKMLVIKPDDQSSVPRIHMVEGENDSHKVFSDFHIHAIACTLPQVNR